MLLSRLRALAGLGFWAALAVILFVSLMPVEEAPDLLGWDKAQHFLAFYALALMAIFAFPLAAYWRIALGLMAFGALIEGLQAIPLLGRSPEWMDWVTDVLGLAAALLPLMLLRLQQWLESRAAT